MDSEWGERDWDSASVVSGISSTVRARNVRMNPSLPPRSVNRPGSLLAANSTGSGGSGVGEQQQQSPRGVVPQREGMF
jgi:hypothetical protein